MEQFRPLGVGSKFAIMWLRPPAGCHILGHTSVSGICGQLCARDELVLLESEGLRLLVLVEYWFELECEPEEDVRDCGEYLSCRWHERQDGD